MCYLLPFHIYVCVVCYLLPLHIYACVVCYLLPLHIYACVLSSIREFLVIVVCAWVVRRCVCTRKHIRLPQARSYRLLDGDVQTRGLLDSRIGQTKIQTVKTKFHCLSLSRYQCGSHICFFICYYYWAYPFENFFDLNRNYNDFAHTSFKSSITLLKWIAHGTWAQT